MCSWTRSAWPRWSSASTTSSTASPSGSPAAEAADLPARAERAHAVRDGAGKVARAPLQDPPSRGKPGLPHGGRREVAGGPQGPGAGEHDPRRHHLVRAPAELVVLGAAQEGVVLLLQLRGALEGAADQQNSGVDALAQGRRDAGQVVVQPLVADQVDLAGQELAVDPVLDEDRLTP